MTETLVMDRAPNPELDQWESIQEAASAVGLSEEAIRLWAKSLRVRSTDKMVGKQKRIYVHSADVRREAAVPRARGAAEAVRASPVGATSEPGLPELRDRVATLEEVSRRRLLIDEARAAIERSHSEIIEQQRAIEELLLGPSWVPGS